MVAGERVLEMPVYVVGAVVWVFCVCNDFPSARLPLIGVLSLWLRLVLVLSSSKSV